MDISGGRCLATPPDQGVAPQSLSHDGADLSKEAEAK